MQIRTNQGKIECTFTETEALEVGGGLDLMQARTRSERAKEKLWAMRDAIISSAQLLASNNLHGE